MPDDATNTTIKDDNVSEILAHDIPYKLGKYEIKNELGRGTCGIVYKGFDPFVRRDVAIKVGWGGADSTGEMNNLSELDFFTEAHAAGKLQHPNIVALFDAQMEKDLSYIVMEYIDGVTLSEYCKQSGKRLPVSKALECIIKCCHALDFSHHMGVIHRDLKPSNIMLTTDGETKLMDFSVAEVTQKGFVTPNLIVGSPSYMSPEQVLRKEVGPRSDLYSLAAVLYHLLVGETLYPLEDVHKIFKELVRTPAPKLSHKRGDLPVGLSAIVEKALSKNPEDRYASGKQMACELEEIYNELTVVEYDLYEDENLYLLKQMDFFKSFNELHLKEIMSVSSVLNFKQGEIIGKDGEMEGSYYIIVEGAAVVLKAEKLLLKLMRGDCFGEPSSSLQGNQAVTLMAKDNTILLKINAMRMADLSLEVQMRYYKSFTENLITRLATPKKSRLLNE